MANESDKKELKPLLFEYRGTKYPGIEVMIGEKKYHFRTEFVINDAIEIGIPLIDMQKYKDPVTGEVDLKKLSSEDQKIMMRWNRDLLTQLSIDHIDFGNSKDIGAFYGILGDPQISKLVQDLVNSYNPPEKKKSL